MVGITFLCQRLYTNEKRWILMVDNKSKDNSTSRTSETQDIYDAVKENFIRTVDEVAKVQPQYSQSISNLQLDYIQTIKNMIYAAISTQKQAVGTGWNLSLYAPYTEQITKQSNEITNNMLRTASVNNQLTINALDAARENLKIYNRTLEAITEFNSNVTRAWNSFFEVQQQHFFRQ
jgi:hypothetical protein